MVRGIEETGTGRALGLPDDAFEQRRPLKGQITKREVRAVSLYALGLKPESVVWDIGAGTGSISVEAALIARQGRVYAIEKDAASIPLLQANIDRWGGGAVALVSGEAPQALEDLPDPDSVFVGGGGGRLPEILDYCAVRLRPGGSLVVNLAVLERATQSHHRLTELGLETDLAMISASRGKQMPGGGLRLESLNPVFVVSAHRRI